MIKVHANDGISNTGVQALEQAGYEVSTTKVAQEQLVDFINREDIGVLLVRSDTTARKELIDAVQGLKLLAVVAWVWTTLTWTTHDPKDSM